LDKHFGNTQKHGYELCFCTFTNQLQAPYIMISIANESERLQERNEHEQDIQQANSQLTKLYDAQSYTAYTEDLEFMWRWTIYKDHNLVQEGCSLTLDASRRAVNHVLAFFNVLIQNNK
jgi:methane monooxygenase component D